MNQSLNSQISQVTVFPDRAQITRTAQLDLAIGEHTLVFDQLPDTIDQNSVQVSGEGKAILANVKFQKVYYETLSDSARQTFYDEKLRLEDELKILNQKNKRLEQEKEFIENIAKKITTPAEDAAPAELDPEKWLKMLEFYRLKLENIDSQLWATEKQTRLIREQLQPINYQLQQAGGKEQKVKNQVALVVQMPAEGSLLLHLSYIVSNARWRPIYDLRVNTETKQMNLTYNALIQQNTGEDWQNVQVKLSTAQPAISGHQPELKPWRIGVYEIPKNTSRGNMPTAKPQMTNMIQGFTAVLPMDVEWEDSDVEKEKSMLKLTSVVETKTTSVFFNIVGAHTIQSDFSEHKVTILLEDFVAHFRYSTVPKLAPYAYLKAKVINNTEFPFLAGESNVFLDNNFVATSKLEAVAPGEEFWTFLGIDEGMKVEYKFLKKYEKKEGGIFSKKTKIWIYEYQIKIKSFKKTAEEIVVWDQLPISGNESVKVQLLEPNYKEDTDKLKKNEWEFLEWFFYAQSGEEILIPFKFSVEYPHESHLTGIG
ncbi:MAG: mucoidy inhibitor MuiA family protein [Microscillaceae bacterium]|jgi:uncharacterized protein (TIGR02231 family)|nr:mucoidy inhibitor MuiA family protein [Microscillaceae bacterium]